MSGLNAGTPCPQGSGVPLVITAHLGGSVTVPTKLIAMDGLLAWATAQIEGLPPATCEAEAAAIEIPVERSECGRFHLCSASVFTPEQFEGQWQNRRFPIAQAQAMGVEKLRSIKLNLGRQKTVRRPREVVHVVNDVVIWFAIGDAERIRNLLALVRHIGGNRAIGNGRVLRWSVNGVESPWPGFPVLRDGLPLRPLPVDFQGVGPGALIELSTLSYPYWSSRRELCSVPVPS